MNKNIHDSNGGALPNHYKQQPREHDLPVAMAPQAGWRQTALHKRPRTRGANRPFIYNTLSSTTQQQGPLATLLLQSGQPTPYRTPKP